MYYWGARIYVLITITFYTFKCRKIMLYSVIARLFVPPLVQPVDVAKMLFWTVGSSTFGILMWRTL